jgi:hypothetical protein
VTNVLSSHVSPIYTNAVTISKSTKSQTKHFKMKIWAFTDFSLLLSLLLGGSAEQCGRKAGGALCPGGLCCSQFGWCGSTNDYCGSGCQVRSLMRCLNNLALLIINSTEHVLFIDMDFLKGAGASPWEMLY